MNKLRMIVVAGLMAGMTALAGCGGGGSSSGSSSNSGSSNTGGSTASTVPVAQAPSNGFAGTTGSVLPAATTVATLTAAGAAQSPYVGGNLAPTDFSGKLITVAHPYLGVYQIHLGNTDTVLTRTGSVPFTVHSMTYTLTKSDGSVSASANGWWTASTYDGKFSNIDVAFGTDVYAPTIMLFPTAADVLNNALVCQSSTALTWGTAYGNGDWFYNGGAKIFMNQDATAALTQATSYLTAEMILYKSAYSSTVSTGSDSTTISAAPISDASFSGKTVYLSSVVAGYTKVTFNANHTLSYAPFAQTLTVPQDPAQTLTGTWSVSGTTLTITTADSAIPATLVVDAWSNSGARSKSAAIYMNLTNGGGTNSAVVFFDTLNGLAQAEAYYQKRSAL